MSAPSNPCVLIVEDDQDMRSVLAEVLEAEGYEVATATNGDEGLTYLRSASPPGVILLDLMMPVKDGVRFRAEQVQDARLAAIPVVVMSADKSMMQKVAQMNVSGHLRKPIELEDLVATVRQFCGDPPSTH